MPSNTNSHLEWLKAGLEAAETKLAAKDAEIKIVDDEIKRLIRKKSAEPNVVVQQEIQFDIEEQILIRDNLHTQREPLAKDVQYRKDEIRRYKERKGLRSELPRTDDRQTANVAGRNNDGLAERGVLTTPAEMMTVRVSTTVPAEKPDLPPLVRRDQQPLTHAEVVYPEMAYDEEVYEAWPDQAVGQAVSLHPDLAKKQSVARRISINDAAAQNMNPFGVAIEDEYPFPLPSNPTFRDAALHHRMRRKKT
jgi:hypothetical protein